MIEKNLITRKAIPILLVITLLITGFFITPNKAHAMTVEKMVTKYHLDIGVQQIWGTKDKNGVIVWDNDIGKGSVMPVDTTITFNQNIYNVTAYEYSASKFKWGDSNYSSNVGNELYYDKNYKNFKSTNVNVDKNSISVNGKTVSFSSKASMKSSMEYDLARNLNLGHIDQVFRLMAGPEPADAEAAVKKNFPSLYSKLNAGRGGVDSNVYAYMYFTPVIIQYDVKEIVEIGSLNADLNLPSTAKTGESYIVSDASALDKVLAADNAVLEKKIDSGEWIPVTIWEGKGIPGENTGGSIGEKSDNICDITYRITLRADDGQVDTAEKKISITDGREISGVADLVLDKYTYEGHPADAEDWSEFTVDGQRYSAKRAYEEKIASNSYKAPGGSVKKDGYDAVVTFPKKGFYPVTLNVSVKPTGAKLTDTESIEVRNTPYVMDSLGGFQKQNRKQTLTFKIATYPDKPIVDYDITIKDLKTNEIVSLTKNAPKDKGACIKTRAVREEINDKYWTTLTVEFLTKYPRYSLTGEELQNFSYKIKVTDSKGDTDDAYKEFAVAPDKPPIPAIDMQTTFLRTEGTNTAKMETADGSKSDGDQLLRTWSVAEHSPLTGLAEGQKNQTAVIPEGSFKNAEILQGYENLAFGTNQTIGWNKEGVGKTTVKLHVKDIWIEPTLPEYINQADYLEAETTAKTDVINIAPKVSIEPLETLKANIAVLVKANEYETVRNQTNELQAALIEKGIDGDVSVVKVADGSSEGKVVIDVKGGWGSGAETSDSERMYLVEPVNIIVSSGISYALGLKLVAYGENAKQVWSYTFESPKPEEYWNNSVTSIKVDNKQKYIIANYIYNGQKTLHIFDRGTGALLKKIEGVGITGTIFLSGDEKRLYSVNDTGICKLELKTGKYTSILSDKTLMCPRLYNGKIGFVGTIENSQYYIGKFDMNSEKLDKNVGPVLDYVADVNTMGIRNGDKIQVREWSNDGKILLVRMRFNAYYSDNYGGDVWVVDTKNLTQKNIYAENHYNASVDGGFIYDELGNADYVVANWAISDDRRYSYSRIHDMQGNLITEIRGNGILNRGYYNKINNMIYLYSFGFYGKDAVYNLNTNSWDRGIQTNSFDSYSGNMKPYDDKFYSSYKDDSRTPFYHNYIQKFIISQDEIVYKGINRNTIFEGDSDTYVVFKGINNTAFGLVNEILDREGAYSISIGIGEAITTAAEKIKEVSSNIRYNLSLIGNKNNYSVLSKAVNLLPGEKYNYSYDMEALSGTAIDVLEIKQPQNTEIGTRYYKEVTYQEDFSNRASGNNREAGVDSTTFTLKKPGYVSLKMNTDINRGRKIIIDGKLIGVTDSYPSDRQRSFFALLSAGVHTVTSDSGSDWVDGHTVIKTIEAGHLVMTDDEFTKGRVNIAEGSKGQVSGSFTAPKEVAFYKEATPYMVNSINGNEAVGKGYLGLSGCGGNSISGDGRILYTHCNCRINSKGTKVVAFGMSIKAPVDKMLLLKCKETYALIEAGSEYSTSYSYKTSSRNGAFAEIHDFELIEIPITSPWYTKNKPIIVGNNALAGGGGICLNNYGAEFIWIDTSNNPAQVSNCKVAYKQEPNTIISFSTANSNNNLNLLISNLKLEMINSSKNVKGVQFKEKFASENSLNNWQVITKGNGRAEMKQAAPVKKDEDAPLIYKKGQLVAYNIFYSDYEKDPSKSGYWIYAHTPYNDGEHENAAIVYDEDGHIKSICGEGVGAGTPIGEVTIEQAVEIAKSKGLKVLTEPIDRFYTDGKYTVYHFEYDDTSRGASGIPDSNKNGYPNYDKVSNTAELTFYIEGGATAPWITGISTSPAKVKENEYFSVNIGIDDAEKDVLNLTTEVYKDRKLIHTHRKKEIKPLDSLGMISVNGKHEDGTIAEGNISYPVINTGALPSKAQAGKYEVVCTVRDKTGAGLGQYKFTVVSEGKITGEVYHTPQWDINRKKYNLNKFSDEINKVIVYSDYMNLKEPRKRGTNVFWSGEKFMLQAAVAGSPTKVTCSINGTSYSTNMKSTGRKNDKNETIYEGVLWENDMINKWGRKEPVELTFTFTATYSGGTVKKHEVKVIVDNMEDYWKLHRVF